MALLSTRTSAADPVAAAELAAYEGIRRGDMRAFTALAGDLQPVLERVAADLVGNRVSVDALIVRTWEIALGGLEMFAWRSRLRAWVVGILVQLAGPPGRLGDGPASVQPTAVTGAERASDDWSDLPWGARWSGVDAAVDAALAAMPGPQRVALTLTGVLGWPDQEARDALGLTAGAFDAVQEAATGALHEALAAYIGEPAVPSRAQVGQAVGLLAARAPATPGPVPESVRNVYRRWRRQLPWWRRWATAGLAITRPWDSRG